MTTCAILADSYFERQRKYGTALVKTPGRAIAVVTIMVFLARSPQQWEFASMGGRRCNFGGLRR
jgi:hypothetical protein